uniref:Homeobox domain-containing protein n=1 Tax=Ganoderma boninense TaxID=34458 RepID=A0A5K1K1D8_9APHY|nr:Homeobox domain-containing protein [Ganoderma boninense]
MNADIVLFLMLLFALYVIRELLLRILPPAPGVPFGVPTEQQVPHVEDRAPQVPGLDPSSIDEEAANRMPVYDASTEQVTVNRDQVATQAGPPASSLPSTSHDHLQRPNPIGASASQSNVLAVGLPQIAPSPAEPGISTASVSTIGPSLVRNFASLRVNTTYSSLQSQGP